MTTARCPICQLPTTGTVVGPQLYLLSCDRCGHYVTTSSTAVFIEKTVKQEDRPLIAEWVYEQNRLHADDKSPFIINDDIPAILSRHKFTFSERIDKFLQFLLENTARQPGQFIDRFDYKIHAALQTFEDVYIGYIVQYLTDEGFLAQSIPTVAPPGTRGRHFVQLTPRGVMRAEELVGAHTASVQGFVAMWFDKSMDDAWDSGFYPGVSSAGFTPRRIDKTEHVNKICDEIIAEIRKSRFLVADFTGHRGGVYYESGYASGRGIPVIWTCHQNDIVNLHFDIRQYNCIDWSSPADLAQRLKARIEAVIGDGPNKRH